MSRDNHGTACRRHSYTFKLFYWFSDERYLDVTPFLLVVYEEKDKAKKQLLMISSSRAKFHYG